jgi:hypothetical protein
MSNELKIVVAGQDRKTLLSLVKAERRNIEIGEKTPVTTAAQTRAISFYEEHLAKIQKKLSPNDNWQGKY